MSLTSERDFGWRNVGVISTYILLNIMKQNEMILGESINNELMRTQHQIVSKSMSKIYILQQNCFKKYSRGGKYLGLKGGEM